jgi:hypothetical protein
MEISTPNENGVLDCTAEEIVARHGRSYAAVNIAFCEDGLYRQSVSLSYSYGGYFAPIPVDATGHASFADARTAGMEELLRRWHSPFPSDPRSVHEELANMRQQIVDQLHQPTFL